MQSFHFLSDNNSHSPQHHDLAFDVMVNQNCCHIPAPAFLICMTLCAVVPQAGLGKIQAESDNPARGTDKLCKEIRSHVDALA